MRFAVVGHVEWVEFAKVERVPEPGEPEVNYHAMLMRDALERSRRGSGARPWELTL